MPPAPTLRLMAEELAAKGWTCGQIADHLGMSLEYARKVVNIVNGHEGGDDTRASTDAHRAHTRAVLLQGGFQWLNPAVQAWSDAQEVAPPRRPSFHRGELVVRGVA